MSTPVIVASTPAPWRGLTVVGRSVQIARSSGCPRRSVVMAAPDAWRCEWKKLDPRGRGSIPFEDLPQLLDGLGVDLSDDELEDAATRIQRWQASRLLLQGFLRWFAGDGGSAKILGDGDLRAARDGLRELNAKHGAFSARDRARTSLVFLLVSADRFDARSSLGASSERAAVLFRSARARRARRSDVAPVSQASSRRRTRGRPRTATRRRGSRRPPPPRCGPPSRAPRPRASRRRGSGPTSRASSARARRTRRASRRGATRSRRRRRRPRGCACSSTPRGTRPTRARPRATSAARSATRSTPRGGRSRTRAARSRRSAPRRGRRSGSRACPPTSRPRRGRARTPGPRPGPRLGGLDIAGLAHRPETSPAPSRSAAPAGRRRDRAELNRAELKPPRKALFLDLLSFTEHIGTTRHFRVPGGRGGLSIPPSSFLKGGHMHRR